MAEFPTFAFTTQEDWYGELSFSSSEDGSAISLAGRQFQMYITPATSGPEPAAPVLIVGMSDTGLSLKLGDPSTLIFRVPRTAALGFARREYTADIIEIVGDSRYLFMPVRVNFSDPSGLRAYLSRFLGISVSFAARNQPIITPVAVAGRQGARGNSVLSETRAPTSSDGIDGDFWFDLGSQPKRLYGAKAAGEWPISYIEILEDVTPSMEEASRLAQAAATAAAQDRATAVQAKESAAASSTAAGLDRAGAQAAADTATASARTATQGAAVADNRATEAEIAAANAAAYAAQVGRAAFDFNFDSTPDVTNDWNS